jgi:hypothetical protein
VAAKGSLEGLANWAAAMLPKLRTVVLRLPKMSTDMSNSPMGRVGAVSAAQIARQVVELVEGDALDPGLTTVGPDLLPADGSATVAAASGVVSGRDR